jgi:hypothetical protein
MGWRDGKMALFSGNSGTAGRRAKMASIQARVLRFIILMFPNGDFNPICESLSFKMEIGDSLSGRALRLGSILG